MVGYFSASLDPTQPDSYEARERKRRLAEALIQQGTSTAPVQHWTQGLARLAQALAGTLDERRIDEQEATSNKTAMDAILGAYGAGGSAPTPGGVTPSLGPVASDGQPAPTPPADIPAAASTSPDKSDFVAQMAPHALKVAQETGLDPRLVIAQAALETGYGKSAPGNNFFGIKSHGAPGGNTLPTTEVVNGQPVRVNDSFRAYADMGDSAAGYANFLKSNPRYAPMLAAQGLDAQIAALGKSGYATDPDYAAKIAAIAKGINLPPNALAAINQAAPQQIASNAPGLGYAPASGGASLSGNVPAPADDLTVRALQDYARRKNLQPPAPEMGPASPLQNVPLLPGAAPILAPGLSAANGPAGGAGLVNPDAPAPGAMTAGPAPVPAPGSMADDATFKQILAGTAYRASNPHPGDTMIPLQDLKPGSAAYPFLEGSPEAQAAMQRSALSTAGEQPGPNAYAPAGSGTVRDSIDRAFSKVDSYDKTTALEGSPEAQSVRAQVGATPANGASPVRATTPTGSGVSDRSKQMLMIALNPQFSPAQRQVAASAFATMQAQDKPMVLQEGATLIKPDGKGGYMTVAGGGPKQSDAIRNYEYYANQERQAGRPPKPMDQWQIDQKRAGATTISIDQKGQGAMQQKAIDAFDTAVKAGADANRRITAYGQLAQAMQGFTPGATAEARVKAKSILKDMGIIEGADVPDAEAFKRVQRQLEIAATPKGQGQITENERVLIRDLIPQIGNSPEGVAKIVQQLKQLDDYDLKVAQIYRDNARKNGGVPNYLEVSDQIANLGPPMTDAQVAALKSLTSTKPPAPTSGAPAPSSAPRWRIVQ